MNFTHIGQEKGLSHCTVYDIEQDNDGFIWVATPNGLNRYNGDNFTVYHHQDDDSCSIGDDRIRSCIKDKQGHIWLGTDAGLSLYNSEKEKFENFVCPIGDSHLIVHGIVEINDKLLLVYETHKTFRIFNKESRCFSEVFMYPELMKLAPQIAIRHDTDIYIGTNNRVYVYSLSTHTLKELFKYSKNMFTRSIVFQDSRNLWVAIDGNGLLNIDPQTQESTHYTYRKQESNSLNSNQVRSLALDAQGQLWIGTTEGLNIFNTKKKKFHTYCHKPKNSRSLSHSSIRDIFMDNQGGVWLGTYYGGLNYYHPYQKRFLNIQKQPNVNSLSCNIIECMVEDHQGGLWIGTNSGGLNYYNLEDQSFTHYTVRNGLHKNNIKSVFIDKENNQVYIGTHMGGLHVLNTQTKQITHYGQNRNIHTIIPAKNGGLWLGNIQYLMRFDTKNKTITSIDTLADGTPLQHRELTAIVRDSKQRLWFLKRNGLNIYTEKENGLVVCNILPSSSLLHQEVICMYEAKQHDGTFWLGTRNGLYCFNEHKIKIEQYTVRQGLPSNIVHGILEDNQNRLWISTDKGLSCFSPQTKKFHNYTVADGLQNNIFNNNCCCIINGRMFFGGINGITTFRPELVTNNPYTPPVYITALKLFNKTVFPDDENQILDKSISQTRNITLTENQTMITLEFDVLNYLSNGHNQFAYMLKGYDKEWYYTHNRQVSYTNLPKGTYHFLIKAGNNDGKWNDTPTDLKITILPPWYKTWWSLFLYAIIIILITLSIFHYFWIRKNMKVQLEMERIDKKRLKEANEMKLRFFINISHELRTPLTMILSPLEEILNLSNDFQIRKRLQYIQQSANRLLYFVNQLLEYQQATSGVLKLKVRKNYIYDVIDNNAKLYNQIATQKKIKYQIISDIKNKQIWCDPSYIELIINNLLSNAFKYTEDGKSIDVYLTEKNKFLLLQVKDTGKGIPNDKQKLIFEYFYQTNNQYVGNGIGLALIKHLVELHHGHIELESTEGKGSIFSIYLPLEESAYQPDEKVFFERESLSNIRQYQYVHKIEIDEKDSTAKNIEQEDIQILIVEDEQYIRQYLNEELSKFYQITEAKNGKEASTLLENQEFDLILSDVVMPIMNGLQFCKTVKQNLSTCHIPVILLSAKKELQEQLEGFQVGADDYISKPFSLSIVKAKIKNLLRTRYHAINYYTHSQNIEPKKITFNPLDEKFLENAIKTVEEHMDDIEFSTEVFAKCMLISRSTLHLKIKALTGKSTNDFIHKIRLGYACKLLKENQYTVSEISVIVGYSSPSYFTSCFKKHIGISPSEYINQ